MGEFASLKTDQFHVTAERDLVPDTSRELRHEPAGGCSRGAGGCNGPIECPLAPGIIMEVAWDVFRQHSMLQLLNQVPLTVQRKPIDQAREF